MDLDAITSPEANGSAPILPPPKDEFERAINIDTTKLTEYLYKIDLQVTQVSHEVSRMVEEKNAAAKKSLEEASNAIDQIDDEEEAPEEEIQEKRAAFEKAFNNEDGEADENDIENRIEALRMVVTDMSSTLEKLALDSKQKSKLQSAKDAAQDEILEMELKRLERQIEGKIGRQEMLDNNKNRDKKLNHLEQVLTESIDHRVEEINAKLAEQFDSVLNQLNKIQSASDASSKIMEERIKAAVSAGVTKQTTILKKKEQANEEFLNEITRILARISHIEEKQEEILDETANLSNRLDSLENHPPIPEFEQIVDEEKLMSTIREGLQPQFEELEEKCKETTVGVVEETKTEIEGMIDELRGEIAEDRLENKKNIENLQENLKEKIDMVNLEASAVKEELIKEIETYAEKMEEKIEETQDEIHETSQEALQGGPMITDIKDEIYILRKDIEEKISNITKNVIETTTKITEVKQKEKEIEKEKVMNSDNGVVKKVKEELTKTIDNVRTSLSEEIDNRTMTLESKIENTASILNDTIGNTKNELIQKDGELEDQILANEKMTRNQLDEVTHNMKLLSLMTLHENTRETLGINQYNPPSPEEVEEGVPRMALPSFTELRAYLSNQINESDFEIARLTRSNISLAELFKSLSGIVEGVATKDNHWHVIETRLHQHIQALSRKCLMTESDASPSRPVSFTKDIKDFIATNANRVAKCLALQADYDVMRKCIGAKGPKMDEDYDSLITSYRDQLVSEFIGNVNRACASHHYTTDLSVLDTRKKFCDKLELSIKLAMSRLNKIQVGATLFGKIKLDVLPSCVACNRPFDQQPSNKGGDKRANCPDPLPCGTAPKPSSAHARTRDPKIAEMKELASHYRDGKLEKTATDSKSSDIIEEHGKGNHSNPLSFNGPNSSLSTSAFSKGNKKAVYRGGFKFPNAQTNASTLVEGNPNPNVADPRTLGLDGNTPGSVVDAQGNFGAGLSKVTSDYEIDVDSGNATMISKKTHTKSNKNSSITKLPPVAF